MPGAVSLLWYFPDHRSPDRRCGRLGRLLSLLRRFLRLSELSERPVHERRDQDDRGYDRTQNARYFFRFHLDIPVAPDLLLSWNIANGISGPEDF
jgi:hypothetical protein